MTAPGPQQRLRNLSGSSSDRGSAAARSRASLALGSITTAALVPAFYLLAAGYAWKPVELSLALAAIALASYLGGVLVRRSALLDAGFVAALAALALLGPLPAACVWIGTEVTALAFERPRPNAFLANVASYGCAVLAGALVLGPLTGAPVEDTSGTLTYVGVAAAGLAMLVTNFLVTRTLVAVVRDGERLSRVIKGELVAHCPATVAMIVIGAATVVLYREIGILALALFSAVVLVPQIVLPLLLKPRPVAKLDHTGAVALYATAIGSVLGLDRADRLVLKDAAPFMRRRERYPRGEDLKGFSDGHRLALVEAVLFHREHWDGYGGVPGALGGEMIPVTSRVLAVADAWAGLTDGGGPRLSHAQALTQLEARADMHFDPRVVAAAQQVVEEEHFGLAEDAAFQPRLHRIPWPWLARRLRARSVLESV